MTITWISYKTLQHWFNVYITMLYKAQYYKLVKNATLKKFSPRDLMVLSKNSRTRSRLCHITSTHFMLSKPPENIKNPLVVCCFKGWRERPVPWHGLKVPPPSPHFLEQKSPILNWLMSFIKPFKTSDFSKHVLMWWCYTWKHFQTYYNKVYHIHKSLCTSYIRVNPVVNPVKWNSQTCIT